MKQDQAIKHILEVCNALKSFIHWQVCARCVLASLFHDARITRDVQKFISQEISNGTLLRFDYLLHQ
jgi:hypothetical protein